MAVHTEAAGERERIRRCGGAGQTGAESDEHIEKGMCVLGVGERERERERENICV